MSAFIDTNILVYAFAGGPKGDRARTLIAAANVIGVQSLNEFAVVMRARMKLDWTAVNDALAMLQATLQAPVPMTVDLHRHGMAIAQRYRLQIYDSLLLAAALQANCTIFFSEDLSDGQVIQSQLTIRNPFA